MSSSAILAFGYDFGEDFDIDWDHSHDWIGDDESYGDAVARALYAAVGRKIEPGDYFDPHGLMQACGIELIHYGSPSCTKYILTSASQDADTGSPQAIDLRLPEAAYRRLDWAIGVLGKLGVKPKAPHPHWLLACWRD